MKEQWVQAGENNVFVLERGQGANILRAACTTANIPSAKKGYQFGCQLYVTDGTTGKTILYINTGSSTSCTFTAFDFNFSSELVVQATASTLTVTAALHHNKIIALNLAAGIAVTLPAAAAGLRFRFIVQTTFVGAATIKSVTGADVMVGHALMGNDSDNTVVDWPAVSANTFDTISMFGTSNSTGGIQGEEIEILGLATNLWFVSIRGDAAGTEATPFQDTVA